MLSTRQHLPFFFLFTCLMVHVYAVPLSREKNVNEVQRIRNDLHKFVELIFNCFSTTMNEPNKLDHNDDHKSTEASNRIGLAENNDILANNDILNSRRSNNEDPDKTESEEEAKQESSETSEIEIVIPTETKENDGETKVLDIKIPLDKETHDNKEHVPEKEEEEGGETIQMRMSVDPENEEKIAEISVPEAKIDVVEEHHPDSNNNVAPNVEETITIDKEDNKIEASISIPIDQSENNLNSEALVADSKPNKDDDMIMNQIKLKLKESLLPIIKEMQATTTPVVEEEIQDNKEEEESEAIAPRINIQPDSHDTPHIPEIIPENIPKLSKEELKTSYEAIHLVGIKEDGSVSKVVFEGGSTHPPRALTQPERNLLKKFIELVLDINKRHDTIASFKIHKMKEEENDPAYRMGESNGFKVNNQNQPWATKPVPIELVK